MSDPVVNNELSNTQGNKPSMDTNAVVIDSVASDITNGIETNVKSCQEELQNGSIAKNTECNLLNSPELTEASKALCETVNGANQENIKINETVNETNQENVNTNETENGANQETPSINENIIIQTAEETKITNGTIEGNKTENPVEIQDGLIDAESEDAINLVIKDIIEALQSSAVNVEETQKDPLSTATENKVNTLTEEEWNKRESVLLAKISSLEEQDNVKHEALEIKLKMKCDENEILKSKLKTLETELRAVCDKPNGKNKDMITKIKKQHEELLTKARGMIFDKTKMIKNQELQIEALTSQVKSLKDVVSITKDLLNIRNMEVVHLQERLECMDMKIQAEKERQAFIAKKMETGTKINEELKKEYEKQMEIFKTLKEKYEEKFQVLERKANENQESTSQ